MKLTSLVFASMAAFGQAETQRGLASLAQKWNISEPTFQYGGLSFELTYTISDYIEGGLGMIEYAVYDQFCAEGNSSGYVAMVANSTQGTGTLDEVQEDYWAGIKSIATNDVPAGTFDPAAGDQMNQTVTMNITLDANLISDNTKLYNENDQIGAVTAEIRFCVRFSLHTPSDVPTPVEVNFLETIVTLNVDLSDGFEIGSIAVEPKDRIVRTANQVYQVRAFQCDTNNDELSPAALAATQNQGSVIRVCVTPDADAFADGIRMRSIDSFSFVRDEQSANPITQVAVADRKAALNLLTTYVDSACTGKDVCNFETILFAAFYTSLGAVFGNGIASMQFGSRRMLREGGREVQEEPAAAAEFELEFGVQPTEEVPSGASSVGAMVAGVLAGVVAALL
jgi:hypothetical protein